MHASEGLKLDFSFVFILVFEGFNLGGQAPAERHSLIVLLLLLEVL